MEHIDIRTNEPTGSFKELMIEAAKLALDRLYEDEASQEEVDKMEEHIYFLEETL